MRARQVFTAALLVACSQSTGSANTPGAARLMVAPETVAPGGSVTLTLSNDTTVAIGYNLCASGLERRAGGGWEAVAEERICTLELRMLDPGAQDRFTIRLSAGLAPGEYRYHTTIHAGTGEGRVLRTNVFRVR